ncbi:GTP-binding protein BRASSINAZOLE INSENSITIVE PALE GREEN 2, chloroplastic [Cucurbita pepo subsp. pepo]|uniref:GTP-binding protein BRASSINAZOLE INSENSITIVE PALE GREEN 2, chloroplastic n=1 Tax=Cucurbita pepo subsp. pepo TaxID=3664 RepID=UPI000C9D2D3C|nr:GTP-binding protein BRASSINAZOLE INSENSITIVE PALE GREEN 2, chloroplastic [Cucurbita pepo subsp. pepo]
MLIARKLSALKLKPILSLRFVSPLQRSQLFSSPFCSNARILCPLPSAIPLPLSPSSSSHPFSSKPTPPESPLLTRDGNYSEATSRFSLVCPGCGVHMQETNPKHPGFFVKPSRKDSNYRLLTHLVPVDDESECSDLLKRGLVMEPEHQKSEENVNEKAQKPTVCSRCHSLRHYGKVKDPALENLLPDFDFDHTIGRRLVSTTGTRSVVLLVVDAADFDGSFPKKVANLVSATIADNSTAWKQGKSGNVPRVVLVVTKIDLLPSSVSPTRFEHWVRQRAREGGINKITSLHMVSAVRDWGLKSLVEDVIDLVGPRGNVWAVGAQNAGKSTLINSIGKHVGGKITQLTEAPVPGTTLGIIRVEGMFPGQAKLFDTPGLLNPHQITTRLTREEQKLVHISKELKPRTYRIKAGHTIHVAGLMRLDVEETSVDTIYVTVWASPYLPLHMGKTENASKILEDHFGNQLQPPIGKDRVAELGKWVRREFHVCGSSWDSSCVDAAAAGLGWFAIGLKGEAVLSIWTYEGIEVVLRSSVIPDRSNFFEDAGFTVSKIVSKADQAANKSLDQSERKKKKGDPKVHVLAETSALKARSECDSA